MPSKLAIMNWSKSRLEIVEQLCDAEAQAVVRKDAHGNVYRLLFKSNVKYPTDDMEKDFTIHEDYDLRKIADARRLARNLYAILGEIDFPIGDLGDGIAFQWSSKSDKGIPVLIRMIIRKREFPYIDVLCRQLEQPALYR